MNLAPARPDTIADDLEAVCDHLTTLHRRGSIDLNHPDWHALTPVIEHHAGPWERDDTDEADDAQAAWKDEQ